MTHRVLIPASLRVPLSGAPLRPAPSVALRVALVVSYGLLMFMLGVIVAVEAIPPSLL